MTEKLFQHIWRFQYFNNKELCLDNGENLQIIFPGNHNLHQGPDFLEAKIKIENTTLVGNIELHILASDWHKHFHNDDENYRNIILHVVWKNDKPDMQRSIPTLSLENRVSKLLLKRYEELMNASSFVACEKMLSQVKDILWSSWKQRLMIERLKRKSEIVLKYQEENNHHWEESFWWMLAKNFGIKVNAEAFEAMAKSVSVNILAKHKNQINQLEALLLGQCGLLEDEFQEDYPKMLQREYRFLKNKYRLNPINMPVHFLRMRPGNFPTIRLAQLAMLIYNSSHLFSKIKEIDSLSEVKKLFSITANDFWNYHYTLKEQASYKSKALGSQMTENIILNTIIPVTFSYGYLHKENSCREKALKWLEELSPEKNHITEKWTEIGVANKNAFDSQSLIELKTQYCDRRKCLDCAIGNSLMKNSI